MPRNKAPVTELGNIYVHRLKFHAHIQFREDDGQCKNIYGPSRATENEAQKDLDQIRAAGGVGATREESLKIMAAEARRIKISAEYQSEIRQTIERMASQEIIDESDYEGDDMGDNSEPEWMKEEDSKKTRPKNPNRPHALY